MAIFSVHPIMPFVFGLLGNIISLLVFLAPLPAFYSIYKKKTSEGFQSVPYVVALFSAMLWLYYTFIKGGDSFLLSINSVGSFVQILYISVYFFYAPKKARILTVKLFLLFNVFGFGGVLLVTQFLTQGAKRIDVLGWICDSFAVCVFAAPLCIMRKVIRTRSVEFMPFYLSLFLTMSAVMWFCYGMSLKDYFVAIPNILGFLFGVFQMILYVVYNKKKIVVEQRKLPELTEQIMDVVKLSTLVCPDVIIPVINAAEAHIVGVEESDQIKQTMYF